MPRDPTRRGAPADGARRARRDAGNGRGLSSLWRRVEPCLGRNDRRPSRRPRRARRPRRDAGRRPGPIAEALAIRDGRIVAVGDRRRGRRALVGPRPGSSSCEAGSVVPGSATRTSIRSTPGWPDALRLPRQHARLARTYLAIDRRLRRRPPGRRLDPAAAAGRWPTSPAACLAGRTSTGSSRIARSSCPSRDGHTRLGQLAGPGAGRRHRGTRRTPIDGRIERDAGRPPTGASRRGDGPRGTAHPADHAARSSSRALRRPAAPPRARASPPGRTRSSSPERTRWRPIGRSPASRRAHRAAWSARCGGIDTAALEQIDELVERRARGPRRSVPADQREDHAGRRHRERSPAPSSSRTWGTTGYRRRTAARAWSTPALLGEAVQRLDELGFQVHFHAIGERAVRECLDAVEVARRANGPSDTSATTSPTSRSSTPTTSVDSRALDVVANAQPLWAIHEPQMEVLTIPFLGPERAAWQYPFAVVAAVRRYAWRWAATGASRRPTRCSRSSTRSTAWPGSAAATKDRFLPAERLTSRRRWPGSRPAPRSSTTPRTRLGSIEIGKLGDLAILDTRPLRRADAGPIGEARVLGDDRRGRARVRGRRPRELS